MEKKVNEILKEFSDELVTFEGDNFFDEGILDSLQVVELVWKLEKAFNIKIKSEQITEDNFKNKQAIISLINKISS